MPAWVVVIQAVGVSIILCNVYVYHKTKNTSVAAGIMLFCMFSIHMANVTFAGGIDTVHYAWIFIFPVLAGGTMEWRGQIFFWAISVVGTVYYYVWPEQMEVLPYEGDMFYTVATRLMCITIFSLIMLTYYFTLREKIQHIQKALKLANFESDMFAGVFNSNAQSVLLVDTNGIIQRANKTAHQTFGFGENALLGSEVSHICMGSGDVFDHRLPSFDGQEVQITTKRHHTLWIEYSSMHVRDENERRHTLFTIEDITERKRFESELSHLAHYDHLTKIPNRLMVHEQLRSLISNNADGTFAVIFIDLDKFKDINDMRGHEAGDAVLLEVANRLQSNIRAGDFIGRFGGDEFILLSKTNTSSNEIIDLVKRLQNLLSRPIFYESTENSVGSSVGIAQYPNDGNQPNDLIRKADAAMYQTKQNDKGGYSFYNLEYDKNLQRKLALNTALNSVIENGELSLVFQPVFDNQKAILGAEALLRWQHPEYGMVSPDEFIPICEDNGQILDIGLWVLDAACEVLKSWQDSGFTHLSMSVNISNKQFLGTNLVEDIRRLLNKYALSGENLVLEITERVIAEDLNLVRKNLELLKEMGITAAVDDFGVAYSSLSYLQQVDVDILKIDRSFVANIDSDEDALNLCKAILSMAKSLKLEVTAEGIENEAHFLTLTEVEVDKYQGFHLSKPISAQAFYRLLNSN